MIAFRASKTVALSSLVTLTLLTGMTPAVATEPAPSATVSPTEVPAALDESSPAEPSPESVPTISEVAPAPVESAPASPAPAQPTPSPSSSVPEPEPTVEQELTPEDYANNPELLAELIGENGADMGQGLERLEVTGDPQEPTPAESLSMSRRSADSADVAPQAAMEPAATNYWQPSSGVLGVDVSSHQGKYVDWNGAWNHGSRFAYVKATEALSYKNPFFGTQYSGSYNRGMIRGAYHFAIPNISSGTKQANYFVANGGGWSADGKTLPPLLDIEYNPYPSLGNTCYNMSASQMVSWIRDFSNRMVTLTGRKPMIYTTTDWWSRCTGNSSAFADHALHVASYNNHGAGRLPNGWGYYSVWQYTSSGPVIGDWNQWNGSLTNLRNFALGSTPPFTDIAPSNPFYKEISWMAKTGISNGWTEPDGTRTYRPFLATNRDMMAAFMYRLAGSPNYTPPATSPFKDVSPKQPFYKEIAWMAQTGISNGWTEPDGTRTYRPFLATNRDMMAAFMYRLAGSPAFKPPAASPFKDVSPRQPFYKEIAWMAKTGVSDGWTKPDGTRIYRPLFATNRDMMAAFIYRYSR